MNFTDLDLHRLPKPDVIETVEYTQILAEMKSQLNGLLPMLFNDNSAPVMKEANLVEAANGERYFKVPANDEAGFLYLELSSEPMLKQLEIAAYREMLLRKRINEASHATMLAYATGADLDQEVARFGVMRHVLDEGEPDAIPPVAPTYESDTSLRRRAQLALEGFSTAGPEGAYVFHALSASADVKDVAVSAPEFAQADLAPELLAQLPDDVVVLRVVNDAGLENPVPGDVAVTVLARPDDEGETNGTPPEELLQTVSETLNDQDVRPLTDNPRVRSANVLDYTVQAQLILYPGVDADLIRNTAIDDATAYAEKQHSLALSPTVSGFYDALHQPGVHQVILLNEAEIPTDTQLNEAAWCSEVVVEMGAIYEK